MPDAEPTPARRISVMLVDDAADIRDALGRLISSDARFTFLGEAPDVEGAAALAARTQPDLALVDVRMPDGGGFEACRRILAGSPRTLVVALSAFATPSLRRRMAEAGAVAYLTKGMLGDDLLDQLVDVMARDASSA